jgi:hypothetical protein
MDAGLKPGGSSLTPVNDAAALHPIEKTHKISVILIHVIG